RCAVCHQDYKQTDIVDNYFVKDTSEASNTSVENSGQVNKHANVCLSVCLSVSVCVSVCVCVRLCKDVCVSKKVYGKNDCEGRMVECCPKTICVDICLSVCMCEILCVQIMGVCGYL